MAAPNPHPIPSLDLAKVALAKVASGCLVLSVRLGAVFLASVRSMEQHLESAFIVIALITSKAKHFPNTLISLR